MASITLYRSAGVAWAARHAEIVIDDRPVGRIRGKKRLTVELDPGEHEVRAHIGSTWTPPLTVELATGDTVILALRVTAPDRSVPPPVGGPLNLVHVEDYADKGTPLRQLVRDRPPVGYRRLTRRERLLWAGGFALLIAGQVIFHTVSRPAGDLIALPGMIIVVVLAFRLFLYRAKP